MALVLGIAASPVLAQIPTAITIPPLPSPPLYQQYLFEDVWAPATILALAAIVSTFILLKRQQPSRALAVGGVCALLSVTNFLVGWLVETPRETVANGTRDMVQGVADADRQTVSGLLDPQAELVALSYIPGAEGREAILVRVDAYAAIRGMVTNHAVQEVQASQDGPSTARTQVLVRVSAPYPVLSWWRLDWRKGTDDLWRCTRIEPLWLSTGGGGGPR
jgi:hypothetical protein